MAFAPKTPDRQTNAAAGAGKRVTTALVTSVMAFACKCSRKAIRVSNKLKPAPKPPKPDPEQEPKPRQVLLLKEHHNGNNFKIPQSPRRLFATISNKATTLVHRKKRSADGEDDGDESSPAAEEDWGDGGVWQRSILMGDKCQPLDFSGVIYYDSNGKQMSELPIRSPRASPLPSYLDRARN